MLSLSRCLVWVALGAVALPVAAQELRLRACDELALSVVAFDDAGNEIPVPRGPQVTLGFQAGSSPWIRFAGADGAMSETSTVITLDRPDAATSTKARVVATPEADTEVTLWAILRSEQPRWMRPSTKSVLVLAATDEDATPGPKPTATTGNKAVPPAAMPAPRLELRVAVTPGTCD